MKTRVSVVGITGYAGEELLKLLTKHKEIEISVLASRSINEPKEIGELYPGLKNTGLKCEKYNLNKISDNSDVVFLALPHGIAFEIVPLLLSNGKKVIDLSADYRIKNPETFEKWYGKKHKTQDIIKSAVYGLPEIYREKIKIASLIANPGCYPTSVILGCAPVLKHGFADMSGMIVDSKSGVSGGGRQFAKEYFSASHPNHKAYKIAGKHRHIPEMEQELSLLAGHSAPIVFTPHIIPAERGMLSCIYLNLKQKISVSELNGIYREFYKGEPFVRILSEGEEPGIRDVVNTNYCQIGIDIDERTGKLVIVSAIDNLIKGASGQAVQNMNIMIGFDEREALV